MDITATCGDQTLVAEAKSTTTSAGLDVDTTHGQFLRRMRDDNSTAYPLVVPCGAVRAAGRVPKYVRAKRSTSIFFVENDGSVRLEGA